MSPQGYTVMGEVLRGFDDRQGSGKMAPYVCTLPVELDDDSPSETEVQPFAKPMDGKKFLKSHSPPLHPPWHSGFPQVRQNKHWQDAVDASTRLLIGFMHDDVAQRTPSIESISVADLAAKELECGDDTSSRCIPYMYSLANKKRLILIGEMHVIALLCYESWKIHDHNHSREFFKSLIPPVNNKSVSPKSPLQEMIWNSIEGIQEQDQISGNGGKEIIDSLTACINRPRAPEVFQTFGDFLDYRHQDMAISLCWASVKFSIGSNAACHSVNLRRIVRLIGDHLLLSNDLALYDKDKNAYHDGMARNFLATSGVILIRRLLSLDSDETAKSFIYALQLESQKLIEVEIHDLMGMGTLTTEEWEYIGALLLVPAGNVLAAAAMSQFGGGGEGNIETN